MKGKAQAQMAEQDDVHIGAAPPARNARRKVTAGRPTQKELERRKAKIMQVATSLFLKNGYAATSLVDIARSARVASRTLYRHFGDKEAIFKSVLFARETAAVFPHPEIEDGDTLQDVMAKAARYVCEVSLRPSTVVLMRLALAESKSFPDLTKKLMDASFASFRSNLKDLFDDLVARKMIKDDDTAFSSELFIDILLGITPMMVYAGWETSALSEKEIGRRLAFFTASRWGVKG